MSIDDVARMAILRLVLRYKSAGMVPGPPIQFGEHNCHKMVSTGFAPNFLNGVDILAESLLERRVWQFCELPNGVNYPAVVRAITDRSSGMSMRVILTEDGVIFDAAGLGNPAPNAPGN